MNEEIVLRFGADTTAAARGMRSIKNQAADLKKSFSFGGLLSGIKGGIAGLGVAVSAGALVAFAKGAADTAENIRTLAEEFGVSTDFLQQWSIAAEKSNSSAKAMQKGIERLSIKIGEARMGNESAIKAFKSFGIALEDASGKALSTEHVFESIRSTYLGLEDAAQRAALMNEMYGKGAVKLGGALRDFEQIKDEVRTEILTERELETLHAAGDAVDQLKGKVTRLGARIVATILEPFTSAQAQLQRWNAQDMENVKLGPTEAEIKAAKEMAQQVEKTRKAWLGTFDANIDESGKLMKLKAELSDLKTELSKIEDGTIEKLKVEEAMYKKHTEVLEQQAKIEKEAADAKRKAHEDDAKRLRKLRNDTNEAEREFAKARRERVRAFDERSKFTVGELADRAREQRELGRKGRRLLPAERSAERIEFLENEAREARARGFEGRANLLTEEALKMRQRLAPVLTESEALPLKELTEAAQDQGAKLAELVELAAKKGVRIIVEEDD